MSKTKPKPKSSVADDFQLHHPQILSHLEEDDYDAPYAPITVEDAIDDLVRSACFVLTESLYCV